MEQHFADFARGPKKPVSTNFGNVPVIDRGVGDLLDDGRKKIKTTGIFAIEENVNGLFGPAILDTGITIWCRGRQLLERLEDGSSQGWRTMTMDDARRLHALGTIDTDTMHRMEVRLLS